MHWSRGLEARCRRLEGRQAQGGRRGTLRWAGRAHPGAEQRRAHRDPAVGRAGARPGGAVLLLQSQLGWVLGLPAIAHDVVVIVYKLCSVHAQMPKRAEDASFARLRALLFSIKACPWKVSPTAAQISSISVRGSAM